MTTLDNSDREKKWKKISPSLFSRSMTKDDPTFLRPNTSRFDTLVPVFYGPSRILILFNSPVDMSVKKSNRKERETVGR